MRREVVSPFEEAESTVWLVCGHVAVAASPSIGSIDCERCDMRLRPDATTLGRRTPTFNAETVPPALLNAHRTSAWAELMVLGGTVDFVDEDPPWRTTVGADESVVIVPDRHHHIEPSKDAEFFVQFYDSSAL